MSGIIKTIEPNYRNYYILKKQNNTNNYKRLNSCNSKYNTEYCNNLYVQEKANKIDILNTVESIDEKWELLINQNQISIKKDANNNLIQQNLQTQISTCTIKRTKQSVTDISAKTSSSISSSIFNIKESISILPLILIHNTKLFRYSLSDYDVRELKYNFNLKIEDKTISIEDLYIDYYYLGI